jgi:hypothetical protein
VQADIEEQAPHVHDHSDDLDNRVRSEPVTSQHRAVLIHAGTNA